MSKEKSNTTIVLTKERRITAIVNEAVEYRVSKARYDDLVSACNTPEYSLEELRSNGEAEVLNIMAEVDEVVMEHHSAITS